MLDSELTPEPCVSLDEVEAVDMPETGSDRSAATEMVKLMELKTEKNKMNPDVVWKIAWTSREIDGGIRVRRTTLCGQGPEDMAKHVAECAGLPGFISLEASRRPADPSGVSKPDYTILRDKIIERVLVPFLGAGASMAVRHGSADVNWFPPSVSELAELLAIDVDYRGTSPYDWNDLSRIASGFVDTQSREDMLRKMHGIFTPTRVLTANDLRGSPHWSLAQCPSPMLIITTNYDTLIEQAFLLSGKDTYDVLVQVSVNDDQIEPGGFLFYSGDPKNPISGDDKMKAIGATKFREYYFLNPTQLQQVIDLESRSLVFKMHGSVGKSWESGTYIITEEDYFALLGRGSEALFPSQLYNHCRENNMLFLGYSLRDVNVRVILEVLGRRSPGLDGSRKHPPHIGIQKDVTRGDQEFWLRRKVRVYEAELREFARCLEEKLNGGGPRNGGN